MKNLFKKITMVLAGAAVLACLLLTGCGKGVNAEYCLIYDNQTDAAALTALESLETFMPTDVMDTLKNGGMRLEVTLYLESTGDYTFCFDYFDPNVTDTTADDYIRYHIGFIGTYTMDGDEITMGAAECGDITYDAGSKYTQDSAYACFSWDGSGESGYWDDSAILDKFPGGTATITDGNLDSWTVTE